jgi:mlo protein
LNKKKENEEANGDPFVFFVYAKMGTFFKKEIFDEHIQQGLVGWAQKAKRRTESIKECAGGGTHGPSSGLEMLRRAAAAIQGSRAPQR